jgi:hypothetical protein
MIKGRTWQPQVVPQQPFSSNRVTGALIIFSQDLHVTLLSMHTPDHVFSTTRHPLPVHSLTLHLLCLPFAATGWDVAAASDTNNDYSGSCGKCKEVKCKPMTFKDGYGAQLDRNGACHDQEASVVVTITDTCPCHYPGNYYSNKRWCCGDMYHL